jgi:hypothetical protein
LISQLCGLCAFAGDTPSFGCGSAALGTPSKIGSNRYHGLIGCHSAAQPKNLLCLSIGKADASLSLSMTSM